jgi:hypothetical protein
MQLAEDDGANADLSTSMDMSMVTEDSIKLSKAEMDELRAHQVALKGTGKAVNQALAAVLEERGEDEEAIQLEKDARRFWTGRMKEPSKPEEPVLSEASQIILWSLRAHVADTSFLPVDVVAAIPTIMPAQDQVTMLEWLFQTSELHFPSLPSC